jgi:hypothetical protein
LSGTPHGRGITAPLLRVLIWLSPAAAQPICLCAHHVTLNAGGTDDRGLYRLAPLYRRRCR